MTKHERFMKFLANEPVDRVPVAFFHHFCNRDDWYKGLERPAAFEENIVKHKAAREKFDPDVVKIMNDTLMIMPVDISFVKSPADFKYIEAPTMDAPFGRKTKELTQRVMEYYADSDAPIYATGFSASMVLRSAFRWSTPTFEEGEAKLKAFAREDPEAVSEALKNLVEGVSRFHEMLIKECGVDGIYYSVNNQAHFFDDDYYRTGVGPYDKAVLDRANRLSQMNLMHLCGYHGLANTMDLFTDFEAAAYNIAVYAEGVSLSEGKKLFGGKPVFGGFAQDAVIYTGTKDEVKKAAWDILDECGQVGVMLGADCTVPNDTDDTRLEWVREAAIEYADK